MDLLSAIVHGDRQALTDMLSEDVVFHSPATIYRGRDQVVDVLAAGGGVIAGLTPSREPVAISAGETLTFLSGTVVEEDVEGVLIEVRDSDARVAEITILLRPLAVVDRVLRLVARALAEAAEPRP